MKWAALFLLAVATVPRVDAVDLCQGLVKDKLPHAMTPLAKPAPGQVAIDPQFGTTIRRISAAPLSGSSPAIVPMYSTVSAWNADESWLILYHVGVGHELYDGHTYRFVRSLAINPNELEGVFWHPTNPDLLFYASGNRLIRYHVSTGAMDVVRTFSFCTGVTSSDTHGFMSWDANVMALRCSSNGQSFFYHLDSNTLSGVTTAGTTAPLVAPSGALGYRDGSVYDVNMTFQGTLDLANPFEHAALGRLASGHDTYNAVSFDPGPLGSGVGSLVTFDMTNGSSRVIVGQSTGYPYPPSGTHVSTLAYRQPGWVFLSIVGDPAGQGVLENELVLADTNVGTVCRIGHHRSFGGNNTTLGDSYWAEPHVIASPSGTRALFASDWGNGATVDTYVAELPGYVPFQITLSADRTAYTSGTTLHASVSLTNVGVPNTSDLYLLMILPDGDQVIDFTDWSFHNVMARLSQPSSLRPIQAGVSLTQPFTVNAPNFFSWTWSSTRAAGTYRLVMMTVRPGALADNRFDRGDVLAVGLATFSFSP